MMLKQLADYKCLYFGCIDEPGHYLFDGRFKFGKRPALVPGWSKWVKWANKRDGLLAPEFNGVSGRALLHHFDGFTVLAFWDRSVDSRGGSNSMFIVPGIKAFTDVIDIARVAFPGVFERFQFDVEFLLGENC